MVAHDFSFHAKITPVRAKVPSGRSSARMSGPGLIVERDVLREAKAEAERPGWANRPDSVDDPRSARTMIDASRNWKGRLWAALFFAARPSRRPFRPTGLPEHGFKGQPAHLEVDIEDSALDGRGRCAC